MCEPLTRIWPVKAARPPAVLRSESGCSGPARVHVDELVEGLARRQASRLAGREQLERVPDRAHRRIRGAGVRVRALQRGHDVAARVRGGGGGRQRERGEQGDEDERVAGHATSIAMRSPGSHPP